MESVKVAAVKISDKQLSEFIELYKRKSGIDLSRREAIERATTLVLMVQNLLRHKPNN